MPIVTETGFVQEPPRNYLDVKACMEAVEKGAQPAHAKDLAIRMEANEVPDVLKPFFGNIGLIAIIFPDVVDGRGFSLAKSLRALGFRGRLRASGPLISDQFPMALACGFDEIEIDDGQAERHPEAHWLKACKIYSNYTTHTSGPENPADL
jgi:uncharacterized protein (DUF934 family)